MNLGITEVLLLGKGDHIDRKLFTTFPSPPSIHPPFFFLSSSSSLSSTLALLFLSGACARASNSSFFFSFSPFLYINQIILYLFCDFFFFRNWEENLINRYFCLFRFYILWIFVFCFIFTFSVLIIDGILWLNSFVFMWIKLLRWIIIGLIHSEKV